MNNFDVSAVFVKREDIRIKLNFRNYFLSLACRTISWSDQIEKSQMRLKTFLYPASSIVGAICLEKASLCTAIVDTELGAWVEWVQRMCWWRCPYKESGLRSKRQREKDRTELRATSHVSVEEGRNLTVGAQDFEISDWVIGCIVFLVIGFTKTSDPPRN